MLAVVMRTIWLRLAALLLLLPALWAGAALADEATDRARLDDLFVQLKAAADPMTAAAIDAQIWSVWTQPSDEAERKAMAEILAHRELRDIAGAYVLTEALIAAHPDYAEAWNQRATLRYMVQDYDGSLADIVEVLKREPRHFGALSGRMMIHLAQGKRGLAMLDIIAALAIHPFLAEKALFPELDDLNKKI